ncbi:unnamed protein product [Nippostrongylus brasiliensis]|uniref:Probable ATP-dependent RNA helicase DDX11 (inferred by orthology to a human protein) n=1 Tax=Nippostrongylus brasiliensis TaxID=27835 RepID=A0A158R1F0_NIPBR|nr:unnamed protein product [Nippostrongylus brasiliensis]
MDEFSFPFPPYDIQLDLMRSIKECIESEQVGIFESPTGTGKSLSVLCATMTWLEEFEKRKEEELERNSKLEVEESSDGGGKTQLFKECEPEDYNSDAEEDSSAEEPLKVVKIFYASRTHSQLEQLLAELKKTRFNPRVVTAASRQTLCVNEKVHQLKFSHLINERCMELRKGTSNDGKKAKIQGDETCVVDRGKQLTACPYFSTRLSLPLCQLVLLPYQVILHASTRAAWGIELKGNVVILDEAHNVLETIGSLHSSEITSLSTSLALSLIRQYLDTYRFVSKRLWAKTILIVNKVLNIWFTATVESRLKPKNLMYMKQLLSVVAALDQYLRKVSDDSDKVITIQRLLIELGVTNVNLFKITHFMDATDMCRKFHGFFIRSMKSRVSSTKSSEQEGAEPLAPLPDNQRTFPSPLFTIKGFIETLSNRCEDGRIVVEKKGNATKLRFILLNPAARLMDVVKEARSTIFIGGTMEPANILVDSLTRGGVRNGIRRFTCSHVIDDHQLLALSLGCTMSNAKFTLTYETRSNADCIKSVAETLLTLAREVPNGCVAFFTSYDSMAQFISIMEKASIAKKCSVRPFISDSMECLRFPFFLTKIRFAFQMSKRIFVEPRGASGNVWNQFAAATQQTDGAILFAVAGGKLSEGINFSDDLGRAVFMVGLPYPNKNSIELKEKMKYLDSQVSGGGNQLYQSLCMHAINQAIGRAIRHRRDYAMVFLLDSRYSFCCVQLET